MEIPNITPEILSGTTAVIISLVLSYVPGLRQKWANLDPDYKRLIFLIILGVVSGGVIALSCFKVIPYITCDQVGLIRLLTVFMSALISSQTVYQVTPFTAKSKATRKPPTK